MKLFEILKATAFTIVKGVEIVLSTPTIKTEARKKKALLELWNSRIRKAIEMTDNVYYKACINSYYGMITAKTMQMLTLDEVIVLMAAILKQMAFMKEGDFNEGV